MKNEKKKADARALFRGGMILSLLHRFLDKARYLLAHGFFSKIFTAYSKEEELLENGVFGREPHVQRKYRDVISSTKHLIARLFESSLIVRFLEHIGSSMLYRKVKTYASFLLSFGVSGLVIYLIKEFVLDVSGHSSGILITAGAILLAIPMFLSSETVAEVMLKSRMLKPVLFDYFGFSRESFMQKKNVPRAYAVSAMLGISFGVLTYFISPVYYILAFGIFLALTLVFRTPELGVLIFVGAIPFSGYFPYPSGLLAFGVLTVGFAYLIKWIRGKRVFKLRLLDKAVLLLAVLFIMGGIVSVGGNGSFESAMLYATLLGSYFLIANLLRSNEWVERTWKTFLFSGLAVSVLRITEIFTDTTELSWVDVGLFSSLGTRITGGFGNPNVYGEYLLMLLPFCFLLLLEQKTAKGKIAASISLLILLICMVNTWSRGAWLGLIVACVLFLLIIDKYSPIYMFGILAVSPIALVILPETVSARFLSIGNFADSSISYRFSVWKGVWRMLNDTYWCGIGVGYSSFSAIYPAFAYGGSETVRHTHSLYLQVLSELGIAGLLTVIVVLFIFVQMCFEHLTKTDSVYGKRLTATVLSSIVGLLVMGITDHIWYDYRIFLAFWVMIALVSAYIRVSTYEKLHHAEHHQNTEVGATLDITFNTFE